MKMKTQLKLAAVVAAGLMASGCSQQMVGQQAAPMAQAAAPVVKTIVDCSKCKKPAAPARPQSGHTHPAIPGCTKSVRHNHKTANGGRHSHKYSCKKAAPRRAAPPRKAPVARPAPVKRVDPNAHTHPAIPNCTRSVRHTHPSGNRAHAHRYSCRKAQPVRQAPQPQRRVNPNLHSHPAIPGCTNSIRHVHPNGRRAHNHRYSCRRPQAQAPRPQYKQVVPVMPKVKAKGTYRGPIKIDGVMQQYQN